MSSNNGKDGEMRAIRVVTYIAEHEENIDFTRFTTTNTADMGADLYLMHPGNYLAKMKQIADGYSPSEAAQAEISSPAQSRIDVKATDKKLQKDTIQKFVGDRPKHPTCQGHILLGGKDMTGPAQKVFNNAQEVFASEGKMLVYINNEGIGRLATHYCEVVENTNTELLTDDQTNSSV